MRTHALLSLCVLRAYRAVRSDQPLCMARRTGTQSDELWNILSRFTGWRRTKCLWGKEQQQRAARCNQHSTHVHAVGTAWIEMKALDSNRSGSFANGVQGEYKQKLALLECTPPNVFSDSRIYWRLQQPRSLQPPVYLDLIKGEMRGSPPFFMLDFIQLLSSEIFYNFTCRDYDIIRLT